ncbi:MAG: GNAT family N-acetyltransferase [Gammaproteobacteria bacterium]|nr:GNAT family N-acetyltransferase [Gammaproteobacteria bacterium]
MRSIEIRPVVEEDLEPLAALAREIWTDHYVPIIGQAQVDYMLERFQSVPAMRAQLAEGYEYFVVRDGERMIGYMAVRPEPQERRLFISKFYLHKSRRGSGTGRLCMEFLERLARQRSLERLWLTVNKENPSIRVYERLGFRIAADIVTDIGNGFVMDDYRMEKSLLSNPEASAVSAS